MAFSVRLWKNDPDPSTPLSAANIMDLEGRLSGYTDSVASGIELGYAESTTGGTTTNTAGTVVITGLSTSVTATSRPLIIALDVPVMSNNAATNSGVTFRIREDGAVIGTGGYLAQQAGLFLPCRRAVRRNPSAGAHTYAATWGASFGGTAQFLADNYTANGPISLHVIQL